MILALFKPQNVKIGEILKIKGIYNEKIIQRED